MRKQYDFSKAKKSPYTKQLKKQNKTAHISVRITKDLKAALDRHNVNIAEVCRTALRVHVVEVIRHKK